MEEEDKGEEEDKEVINKVEKDMEDMVLKVLRE